MRYAALATLAALAFAGAAPTASALTVETKMGPEFQKKLDKDYGNREVEELSSALSTRIQSQFAAKGVKADRVVVTILDAKPNRPTFQQISDRIGLDPINSISIGGAHLSGVAYDASGKEVGTLDYDWYETDISQVYSHATWSDARWTFDRFARKFADKIG
jgi:hypothetical protein